MAEATASNGLTEQQLEKMLNDIVAKTEATRGTINVSEAGLEFGDFNGLWRLAKWFHAAGWTPKGIDTVEKIAICIARGRDLGLRAMQALDCIGVVNGRPMMYGDAPLAVARQHKDWDESGFKEWIEGDGDKMVAVCTTLRRGATEPRRQEFSVADARAAGLWGKDGPWKLYPKRMLMFRARGYCLRDNFGDALKGLGIRELADDADDPIKVPAGPPVGNRIKLGTNGTAALDSSKQPPAEIVLPAQAEPENRKPELPPCLDPGEDEMARRDMIDDFAEKIAGAKTDKELSAVSAELARHHQFLGTVACDELIEKMRVRTQEIKK